MSRPKIIIDPGQLEKLAEMCATQDEVAAWFNTSRQVIGNRLKREPLKGIWEKGLAKGRIALRRAQLQLAMSGNATMQIWLGKQLLGQVDKTEQKVEQTTSFVVEAPAPLSMDDWSKAFSGRGAEKDKGAGEGVVKH
jgi:hypothetical protein